jgi:hypothetical protein
VALDELQENEARIKVDDIDILIPNNIRDYALGSQIDYYDYHGRGWFTVERFGNTSC